MHGTSRAKHLGDPEKLQGEQSPAATPTRWPGRAKHPLPTSALSPTKERGIAVARTPLSGRWVYVLSLVLPRPMRIRTSGASTGREAASVELLGRRRDVELVVRR